MDVPGKRTICYLVFWKLFTPKSEPSSKKKIKEYDYIFRTFPEDKSTTKL